MQHRTGTARVTVLSVDQSEVTLGIEQSDNGDRFYEEVTLSPQEMSEPASDQHLDVLELLLERGRR